MIVKQKYEDLLNGRLFKKSQLPCFIKTYFLVLKQNKETHTLP